MLICKTNLNSNRGGSGPSPRDFFKPRKIFLFAPLDFRTFRQLNIRQRSQIKLPYLWGKTCLPNISDFQCSISSFLSWITSKMAVLSFDLNTFLQNSFSWQGLLQVMILKAEVSCNIFFEKKDIFQTSVSIQNWTDICYSFFRLVCTPTFFSC